MDEVLTGENRYGRKIFSKRILPKLCKFIKMFNFLKEVTREISISRKDIGERNEIKKEVWREQSREAIIKSEITRELSNASIIITNARETPETCVSPGLNTSCR